MKQSETNQAFQRLVYQASGQDVRVADKRVGWYLVPALFLVVGAIWFLSRVGAPLLQTPVPYPALKAKPLLTRLSDRILPGESLSQALERHHVSSSSIFQITASLQKQVNLQQIHPGDAFVLEYHAERGLGRLGSFELIHLDEVGIPIRYQAKLHEETAEYTVQRFDPAVSKQQMVVSGVVENSLYESMIRAGGDPNLVNRFAELFGWQMDFYREAKKGDRFRIVVESRYVDGRFSGYGRMHAAQYSNATRNLNGFYFESRDRKIRGFFNEKGESLERSFLAIPIPFARITSRYGQRFHPVLGRKKQHNGIDYGAKTGTPIGAAADGTVVAAGYNGAAGNMVRIQHNGGYQTEYFHASRIAKGIRVGAKVKQKQVIAYVGSTGRSTGPHLHYGMKLRGRYVDPSKQKFKGGTPIPPAYLSDYRKWIRPMVFALETGGLSGRDQV